MKVAALYDIHANLPALEAVLQEIDQHRVDLIVVGGDMAWGPFPRQTLDSLLGLGDKAAYIRGNADRDVADPRKAHVEGWVAEVNDWCADQLSLKQREFLRNLPTTLSLDIPALDKTLFCHATPRRDDETFTAVTPAQRLLPVFARYRESTIVCGHTHMQFDRKIDEKRVINAGSVGLPYEEEPGAYWVLFDNAVTFIRTEYDIEAAAAVIASSPCPRAEEFAMSVKSPPPPTEARQAFEKRALR